MILLLLLTLICIVLTALTIVSLVVGGASTIIVFGDVIVCIIAIAWLIKKIINKKSK